MGCDIHPHVEVKINGRWEHYNAPNVLRNYRLFAKMAGVRNYPDFEITPICEPRGLPGDASTVTKFSADRDGCDGHSHSYLTADEFAQLVGWYEDEGHYPGEKVGAFWFEDQFGFLFGNSIAGFAKYPSDRPPGLEDVRVVFWFDN